MIRIDSGKFKGRRLSENKFEHIRPTTDKVRQALFTKLQFFLPNKRVLDLFCGTGALGIEALSRGASEVIFVDKDYRSCKMTRENLKAVSTSAKVIKCDALTYLDKCQEKFDLILLDPPYKSGLYEKVIPKLYDKLDDDGVIVCEHDKKDTFDYSPFVIYDEKRYGNTMLTYLSKN